MEEGAEEFFLKPVQLSDVNKLRPHLLKSCRAKENQHNNINMRKAGMEKEEEEDQSIESIRTNIYKGVFELTL